MSCGIGCRCSSDLVLLWLWLVATALIWPLAWEPPYAAGAALKQTNKTKGDCDLCFGHFPIAHNMGVFCAQLLVLSNYWQLTIKSLLFSIVFFEQNSVCYSIIPSCKMLWICRLSPCGKRYFVVFVNVILHTLHLQLLLWILLFTLKILPPCFWPLLSQMSYCSFFRAQYSLSSWFSSFLL